MHVWGSGRVGRHRPRGMRGWRRRRLQGRRPREARGSWRKCEGARRAGPIDGWSCAAGLPSPVFLGATREAVVVRGRRFGRGVGATIARRSRRAPRDRGLDRPPSGSPVSTAMYRSAIVVPCRVHHALTRTATPRCACAAPKTTGSGVISVCSSAARSGASRSERIARRDTTSPRSGTTSSTASTLAKPSQPVTTCSSRRPPSMRAARLAAGGQRESVMPPSRRGAGARRAAR